MLWELRLGKWVGVVDVEGMKFFCGASDTDLTVATAIDRMRIAVRRREAKHTHITELEVIGISKPYISDLQHSWVA